MGRSGQQPVLQIEKLQLKMFRTAVNERSYYAENVIEWKMDTQHTRREYI